MGVQQDVLTSFVSQMNVGWLSMNQCITVKSNKMVQVVLEKLYDEGFVKGYIKQNSEKYKVWLNYPRTFLKKRSSSKYKIYKVSKPSNKIYYKYNKIKILEKANTFCCIYSTSLGIMSGREIVLHSGNLGGEILIRVENY